jgi:WD40 repeat protein
MQQNTNHVGQRLGNYRLIQQLGRGGFAEVYLGEHVHLKTQAAIKVLLTHLTQESVEMFRSEAQMIAHLRHSSIVQVHDFGLQDDTAYLIMDYAPHGTLRDRHPKGSILPLATVVTYVKQMAEALQYAHEQRLIHRDVKPENMLLGPRYELLLSDFGIALTAHSSFSQSVENVAGTIVYMAPEQIQGHPRPASDQYALGIVVYEWLCGKRPFQGTFTEVALQHTTTPPPPLHLSLPMIPQEIEQVVMTALNKDPQRRFPTIRSFAQALEQVSQRQNSFSVGNNPSQLASTFLRPPSSSLHMSSQPMTPSTGPYPATLSGGYAVPPPSYSNTTIPPFTVTPPLPASPLPGQQQPRHLSRRTAVIGISSIVAVASSGLTWIFFSQRSANSSSSTVVGGIASNLATTTTVPISANAALVTYKGHASAFASDVLGVDWSPNGKLLASVAEDGTAQVWTADTSKRQLSYSSQITPASSNDNAHAVRWLRDSKRFVVGFDDGTAQEVEVTTGKQLLSYGNASASINALACSPDEKYLALASNDGSVQVYELTSGKMITRFTGHVNGVLTVAWSHDGQRIASGGNDSTAQVWNARTGQALLVFKEHTRDVSSVFWSGDDSHLVSCSLDNTARVWDSRSGRVLLTYSKHASGWLNAVAWSPDGKYIASAGEQGTVTGNVFIGTRGRINVNMHLWDAKTGNTHAIYQSLPINAVAWSPDNTRIATACTNSIAQIWRVL